MKPNEKGNFNLGVTLEKAISKLSQADPRAVCLNSGVIYNREQDYYILPYLHRKYLVYHSTGAVKSLPNNEGVSLHLQILFLHYLAHADGTPLTGTWVTFKELPGGQIYSEPYYKRTIQPLLKYFGCKQEKFEELALSLKGQPASFGDLSIVLQPLPRVPLVYTLWEGDQEFAPAANILYDASTPHYLPTEDCALLPGLIIWEMVALLPH